MKAPYDLIVIGGGINGAAIARDGAIQTATIERDRTIEIARITTAVQTAQKSEEESTATAAANEARALAVRAGLGGHGREEDRKALWLAVGQRHVSTTQVLVP